MGFSMRLETDSMGTIEVDNSKYWGAQTERSLHHFSIGSEHMPIEIAQAFGILKHACAFANNSLGKLDSKIANAIIEAATEVAQGKLDAHFPLYVWQTGSGTQSNMNANEVIANRAIELLGGTIGSKAPVHPNDHVNLSQSSNDTFPTAMHVATACKIIKHTLPELRKFLQALRDCERRFFNIVKIGRTHLQDAVPLTLDQMFSGYIEFLERDIGLLDSAYQQVLSLAIGGTAVGTGLNTHIDFSGKVSAKIAEITGLEFISADNKFAELSGHQAMLAVSAACNSIACSLNKIANDIRWLGSGPRCGIGELILPANEPGSSIMPGKVNPTQSEAMTMLCVQVIGNHTTVSSACSQGNFELNVFKPVIAYNVLQSLSLIGDGCSSFRRFCLDGLQVNQRQIDEYVEQSLMLVTALNPIIGYDKASKIAQKADADNTTLKQACMALGFLTEAEFDRAISPMKMAKPHLVDQGHTSEAD